MNLFETDPGENFFSFDSEKEGRRGREGLMERKRMEEEMEEGERIVVKSLVRHNRKKMRRVSLGTNEAGKRDRFCLYGVYIVTGGGDAEGMIRPLNKIRFGGRLPRFEENSV